MSNLSIKKCLTNMRRKISFEKGLMRCDVSKGQGRTVLFVSHNMAAVKSLCNRGIVLEHGLVKFNGNVETAVSYYLGGGDAETQNKREFGSQYQNKIFTLNEISLQTPGKPQNDPLVEDEPIMLTANITIYDPDAEKYHLTYHLYNELGEAMFSFHHAFSGIRLHQGENKVSCMFPAHFFQSGNFNLAMFVIEDKKKTIFMERDIITFTIVDGGREFGVYMGREPGYIKPQFEWIIQ
jgi:lipopolysaccharide transport system ATP-binding protein